MFSYRCWWVRRAMMKNSFVCQFIKKYEIKNRTRLMEMESMRLKSLKHFLLKITCKYYFHQKQIFVKTCFHLLKNANWIFIKLLVCNEDVFFLNIFTTTTKANAISVHENGLFIKGVNFWGEWWKKCSKIWMWSKIFTSIEMFRY